MRVVLENKLKDYNKRLFSESISASKLGSIRSKFIGLPKPFKARSYEVHFSVSVIRETLVWKKK
mgnify:CR=1 FL=1